MLAALDAIDFGDKVGIVDVGEAERRREAIRRWLMASIGRGTSRMVPCRTVPNRVVGLPGRPRGPHDPPA